MNLPGSTGFSTLLINRGSVSNEGIELSLSAQLVNTNDFSIDFGGNISFNRSEILDLGIPDADIIMDGEMTQRSYYLGQNVSSGTYFRSPANIFIKGEEIGLFYGYETDGIYQEGDDISVANFQAGDVRIIDQLTVDSDGDGIADSGDGVIDNNDRTIIGNPNPDFIFGMNLNMSYKRFNLSALFNGSYGNDIANGNLLRLAYAEGTGRNVYAAAYHNAGKSHEAVDVLYSLQNQSSMTQGNLRRFRQYVPVIMRGFAAGDSLKVEPGEERANYLRQLFADSVLLAEFNKSTSPESFLFNMKSRGKLTNQ